MSKTVYNGGCLCGATRYEASGSPTYAITCYCPKCRKLSSSGHIVCVVFPENTFKVTGQTRSNCIKVNTGVDVVTHFCSSCGSSVFGSSSDFPKTITIRVESLDNPSEIKSQIDIRAQKRTSWDHINPAHPDFSARISTNNK